MPTPIIFFNSSNGQPVAAAGGQEALQLRPEGGIILLRHHAQGRSREAAAVYPDGSPAPQQAAPTLAQAAAQARALVQAQGMPLSAAAKQAAAGTPFSKSEIYKACLGDTAQAAQKEGTE